MSDSAFNPYDPAFAADPYPAYARLRENQPVFYSREFGLTFFTRYNDIVSLLADRNLGRSLDIIRSPEETAKARLDEGWDRLPNYSRFVRTNLLETEGPDHERLRRLIAKAFSPVRIRRLRKRVQELTDDLLQNLLPQGQMDFIADLAVPLPVFMISELLGWPPAERHRLRPWSADIVRLYEKDPTPEDEVRAETAATEFAAMVEELANRRRTEPADDLISALVRVEAEGDRLSNDELIASCILLLNAGHEATVNAAGNGLLALLRHPDQLELLKKNPSLLTTAIEESLRYDAPLQFFHRFLLADMEYEGHRFRKGDTVGFLYGSANRDGEAFENPDRFDIAREPNRHLAFGRGAHSCLGAPLARLELKVLFATLLRRIPKIRLDETRVEFRTGLVFRGLKRLRLSW